MPGYVCKNEDRLLLLCIIWGRSTCTGHGSEHPTISPSHRRGVNSDSRMDRLRFRLFLSLELRKRPSSAFGRFLAHVSDFRRKVGGELPCPGSKMRITSPPKREDRQVFDSVSFFCQSPPIVCSVNFVSV
ncbi:hypothetical protein M433DRAFT_213065 [Acidomyces richmondensis BFW]|nr:MAG: hypothetical protein FE78DRAFT_361545 [Acidomyces sp. 'richmondensis']KYG46214.1 hypothetical protein M433DRAFT_213065 [Acidomyces richmondensis BFW]